MLYGMLKKMFALSGLVLAVTGCAMKTTIHALEPAEVDRAASFKRIAIVEFDHDNGRYGLNLAAKLEALLTSYRLDGKNYFVVVGHSDLDRILDEQKRQHSGLFSQDNIAQIGKLTGAQALISGVISSASSDDSLYRDVRTRSQCDSNGKNCMGSQYSVNCRMRVVSLGVQVKMMDVERGDLITAQSFNESRKWSACHDRQEILPSREQGLELLSNRIAQQFVRKITPRYVSFDVTLLKDPDVDLTENQEERFEASLEFIEADRMDRADLLLTQLHQEIQHQSYVIAYNLGVTRESEGDYDGARELYHIADQLALEPVDEINAAVQRIERLVADNKRALNQLNRD